MTEPADRSRATLWQRRSAKGLAAFARKNPGQPLEPGDWEAYFRYAARPRSRVGKSLMAPCRRARGAASAGHAERGLFPEALIDELIGDQRW